MDGMNELDDILRRFQNGNLSAEVALMELLATSEDLGRVEAAVADSAPLKALFTTHAAGCARIVDMLKSNMDSSAPAQSATEGVEFARRLFDYSVSQNEETSVAMYSLGSPDILRAATAEVIASLTLTPSLRVAEIGCGIGRFLTALSPKVKSLHGLDVSPGMVEVARRRTADCPNVTVSVSSGRDLMPLGDGEVDLLLAIDVFPYLVQAGVVDEIAAEIKRVLAPGGVLSLMQFSYRDDIDLDRREFEALADRHGLIVTVAGEPHLGLWNRHDFGLRRPHITPPAPPRKIKCAPIMIAVCPRGASDGRSTNESAGSTPK